MRVRDESGRYTVEALKITSYIIRIFRAERIINTWTCIIGRREKTGAKNDGRKDEGKKQI